MITKTAIFTIVTKNYFGLANLLMQSVADNARLQMVETFVFLGDEADAATKLNTTDNHLVDCKNLVINDNNLWNSCAFKYNVTEFCTFLKPYCIEYLYAQGFTNVIYFDPDIYVFNELDALVNNLKTHAVILTPHITQTNSCLDNPVFTDISFANNGIFNLGFIAVNNSEKARELVAWWKRMVTENGYVEYSEGFATDQKWMDFAPAFLGQTLLVERGLGYNAGFWNIQEREIVVADNVIAIKERNVENASVNPLFFFHFSALYYPDMYDFTRSKYNYDFVKRFPDLGIIFTVYSKNAGSNFSNYSSLQYSYGHFDNGVPISHINRRLYRRLIETDNDIVTDVNPFESSGPFYKTLQKNKLLTSTATPAVSVKVQTVSAAPVQSKDKPVYTVLRLAARLFGLKAINRIISAGKSMGKEEAHMAWLQKDFYKYLKSK